LLSFVGITQQDFMEGIQWATIARGLFQDQLWIVVVLLWIKPLNLVPEHLLFKLTNKKTHYL